MLVLALMRMEIWMKMESLRPVEDTLRFVTSYIIFPGSILLLPTHLFISFFLCVDGLGQDLCCRLWIIQMC